MDEHEQAGAHEAPALLDEKQRPDVDRCPFDPLLEREVQPPVLDGERGPEATAQPVGVVPAGVLAVGSVSQRLFEDLTGAVGVGRRDRR
ncbi:hypothetical protein ACFQL1_03940 [Halomicroarcula sp. GCM10025709]|uniref:hypothetical protein n=1 Tax=Halomicroarcula sp. GCM10025709 TaxID=3252669 RepID=UPI003616082E